MGSLWRRSHPDEHGADAGVDGALLRHRSCGRPLARSRGTALDAQCARLRPRPKSRTNDRRPQPCGIDQQRSHRRSATISDALTHTLHGFGLPVDANGPAPDKRFNGAAADQPRKYGSASTREPYRAALREFRRRWTSGSGDGFTAGLRRRGAADFETTHGPWLPFHPLDECRRNLVFHDHDAQDAIFPQERSGANSDSLDGGIRSPCCGKIGRGASPHRRDESEHDVDGRASTVVPPGGAGGTASSARSISRGCVNGGSCLGSACSSRRRTRSACDGIGIAPGLVD